MEYVKHSPPISPRHTRSSSICEGESPKKRSKLAADECFFDENLSPNVRLIVKNGDEFLVERNLLSYYSNYFRCLFNTSFGDSKQEIHRIRLVSAADLRMLLTIPRAFEKGIKPELTLQRALQLLEPAAYLQVDLALDYITHIISQHLNFDNIVRIFRLSLLFHIPLAIQVWERIIKEFQTLYNTKEYLKLSESELIALLSDKKLNIQSEDEKKVIDGWMKFNRSENVPKFAKANFERKSMPDSTKYEVIRTRQPLSGVVAFGGWSMHSTARHVEIFNSRSERWHSCKFNFEVPTIARAYHGNEIIKDTLVVYGGFNGPTNYSTTLRVNLKTKEWKFGRNMHEQRIYALNAKTVDSQGKELIYCCGGKMSATYRTKSCEMYDFEMDRWNEISPMHYIRSDGGMAGLGEKVMAVGGFDGQRVLYSAEIYDPHRDCWTTTSRQMRIRRTGVCAVGVMDQVAIVCGGYNGSKRLDSAEMYDLREGIWHTLPLMHCGRSNFGITVTNNHVIHVAGGFDGQSTSRENERMDLRNRRWQALPDMNEHKSALRLLNIVDHPCLDELFDIPDDDQIVKMW